MHYSDTRQLFEQACEFPADHETVVERLGDVTLTTQTGDSATVSEVLTLTDETTYRSPDALYTSLVRNLDDGFIGRKYYDDRSGTTSGAETVRGDSGPL